MTNFENTSKILTRTFKKRTLHSHDQYYDLDIRIINDTYHITLSGSTISSAELNLDKEVLEKLIADLQEITKL